MQPHKRLNTDYFGRADEQWMINFRVRDLEAMVEQRWAARVEVTADPEKYPNGRFARLYDPEGNPIELMERVQGSYRDLHYEGSAFFESIAEQGGPMLMDKILSVPML